MKLLIGAALASTALLTGAAMAADAVYIPPPVEEVFVEEGPAPSFYLGVHAGYGWGFADHTSQNPGNDLDLEGWFLGAQAGVNIPLDSGLFVGFEVDGSWANITGSDSFGVGDITHTIDWFGSARGKLGFDADGFRPYVTAGIAAAGITRDVTTNGTPPFTNTQVGWTAGLGVDVPVAEQVSLNFEWRFSDYGEAVFETGGIGPTVHTTAHTARAGLNFEF